MTAVCHACGSSPAAGVRSPTPAPRFGHHPLERDRDVEPRQFRQVHQGPQQALRLTAQPEGISRAGRPLAAGEQAHDRVEFVGDGDRRPGQPPRTADPYATAGLRARCPAADSDGRSPAIPRRAALFAGVDAAHGALQFGQFAHHVGGQIDLGQPRGAAGVTDRLRHPRHVACHPPGEMLDAQRLRPVAAEPLVEQHGVEAWQMLLESGLPVRVPEEPRIAQPRDEHALEIARDRLAVVRLGVDHRQERRQQLARLVHHGEEMLVVDHRGRQYFVGEAQEFRGECARHHRRVSTRSGTS